MRTLVLSRRTSIDKDHQNTIKRLFSVCGNLGNMLFLSAIERIVPHALKNHRNHFDAEKISENADLIVIPAANWISEANDLGNLAEKIERSGLGCVVVGLGAQAISEKKLHLKKGTKRFLDVVSERSHSISVRGAFTASVLEDYGVKNVSVTGCPSLLWHLDRSAEVARTVSSRDPLKVAYSITPPAVLVSGRNEEREKLSKVICDRAFRSDSPIVLQTELELMRVGSGEVSPKDEEYQKAVNFFWDNNGKEMEVYLRNHMRIFSSASEWMAFSSNHDLVLGTRLHGVISALLSGTPAVLITHDTRTREMSKKAGIPSVTSKDIMEVGILPKKILENADFVNFNKTQRDYFSNFVSFFEENGVPHNLKRLTT